MTKKEYLEFHQNQCKAMVEMTAKKNADYTGIGDDPFANFRICEHSNIASAMQGFLVRMSDKMARVNSFAQKGYSSVENESVHDTLLDLANYAILMSGFIKSETSDKQSKLNEMVWGGYPSSVEKIDCEIITKGT